MLRSTPHLVLHVGYPKTGTTTLQKKWLNKFSNQINPFVMDEDKIKLRKEMANFFRQNSPESWSTEKGAKIIETLWKMIRSQNERFIYSHENLCWPWFYRPVRKPYYWGAQPSDFHFVNHLEVLQKQAPFPVKIDVMVTVRNQIEWFPSVYAQQSHLMKSPSQKDFVSKTKAILSDDSTKGAGFVEYNSLLTALHNVVGKGSVHFFFLEEISTQGYWDMLSRVTGLPVYADLQSDNKVARENVRSVGQKQWRLRPDQRFYRTRFYKHASKNRLAKTLLNKTHSKLLVRRNGIIELTSDLENEISDRYLESNKLFSEKLGRPLPPQYHVG